MKPYSTLVKCLVVWLFLHLMASTEVVSRQMEDVIYLKDGSIIRGVIIEQVPGVRVKIQTRGENIFVYLPEQIDKIMEEPMAKKSGRKNSEFALGLSLVVGGAGIDGVGQVYNGDVGKGFGFLAWCIGSWSLIIAGMEDNVGYYPPDVDGDDGLVVLGLGSRIGCYITASVDAYRSAKRKNEEGGYGKLPGSGTQEHPILDIGLGKHGEILVAFRHTF